MHTYTRVLIYYNSSSIYYKGKIICVALRWRGYEAGPCSLSRYVQAETALPAGVISLLSKQILL